LTVGAAYASEVTLEAVGDPVVTYSIGKVRQYYKITLPRPSIEVSGTLTIDDGKSNTKTFNIYFNPAPLYSDTGLRAILVGGKYWSPVNVGATSTTYSADLAGCGYVYQWGRSYIGFAPGSGSDTQGGPVTAAQASGTYAAKFITVSGTPFDWLSPQDDLLWSGDNSRGPCPAGWRVPTDVELTVLNSKYNIANIEGAPSSIRLKIPRDSEQSFGDDLYLPAVGFRTNSTGAWANQGTNGYYWSSTVPGTSARAFNFHASSSSIAANPRGYGISVRCIQE
ncbi:MAG: fibrobacter succinogenes major paralogous domain-containing protein, partial [Prevotella sp.]|nr:fibrobacter succinogenes major paralogous domain-containing protein [Prevotella sp.]